VAQIENDRAPVEIGAICERAKIVHGLAFVMVMGLEVRALT
jgi:hypothetical protein